MIIFTAAGFDLISFKGSVQLTYSLCNYHYQLWIKAHEICNILVVRLFLSDVAPKYYVIIGLGHI